MVSQFAIHFSLCADWQPGSLQSFGSSSGTTSLDRIKSGRSEWFATYTSGDCRQLLQSLLGECLHKTKKSLASVHIAD